MIQSSTPPAYIESCITFCGHKLINHHKTKGVTPVMLTELLLAK